MSPDAHLTAGKKMAWVLVTRMANVLECYYCIQCVVIFATMYLNNGVETEKYGVRVGKRKRESNM